VTDLLIDLSCVQSDQAIEVARGVNFVTFCALLLLRAAPVRRRRPISPKNKDARVCLQNQCTQEIKKKKRTFGGTHAT
jgi:hypothetical protein